MQPGDKLYTVTRRDLSPGYQMAQAGHALARFAKEHPGYFSLWMEVSEYICFLSVADETELFALYEQAVGHGLPVSIFREPDLDYQLTAITLEPGLRAAGLCARLPLALSELNPKRKKHK